MEETKLVIKSNTSKEIDLKKIKKGLYLNENFIIKGLEDFGFEYNSKNNIYYKDGLYVDVETKLVYALNKTYDLTVIVDLYKRNIVVVR